MHNCSLEINTLYKAPEGDAVGWRRLYQDEFLHSTHMLSSTGPFFELAFSVICYCLMEYTKLSGLNKNHFIYLLPNHSWAAPLGLETLLARWPQSHHWQVGTRCWPGAWMGILAGASVFFDMHLSIHVIRLDFSQQGSFRIVRSYLIAGYPQSAEAEATGFLKTSTKQIHHHFCYILLVTKWVQVQGERTTNAREYLEYCSLRAIKVYCWYISSVYYKLGSIYVLPFGNSICVKLMPCHNDLGWSVQLSL